MVFELARALKAIPALADAEARDSRDPVRRWHERALPIIGTKPFDETWADFVTAWPRVKHPKGSRCRLMSDCVLGFSPIATWLSSVIPDRFRPTRGCCRFA